MRTKRGSISDSIEVKIETEEKLLNKSKLIMKREKAKLRVRTKLDRTSIKIETKSFSEGSEDSEFCGKNNNKNVLQMVRNRISAQNSRDRKKMYLNQLEEAKNKLHTDTQYLTNEKNSLMKELYELRESNRKLQEENQGLKMSFENGFEQLNQKFAVDNLAQQSFQETIRNVIKNFDPATQKLLNENTKNLYDNTSNFAVFFSIIFMLYKNNQESLPLRSKIKIYC